jgi:MOSC domain-containing protein YiiM
MAQAAPASVVHTGGVRHRSVGDLEAGLDEVRGSPADEGVLELIVARPAVGERALLEVGELSTEVGLVGDNWDQRASKRSVDGGPHPDMQLNLINARLSTLIAAEGTVAHRALTGDQLHVDLDLSERNLPAGTRLALGGAIIEVTDQPHTGCAKFADRFGAVALRFVNVGPGKELRLRGINAKVVQAGTIAAGDVVKKLS